MIFNIEIEILVITSIFAFLKIPNFGKIKTYQTLRYKDILTSVTLVQYVDFHFPALY